MHKHTHAQIDAYVIAYSGDARRARGAARAGGGLLEELGAVRGGAQHTVAEVDVAADGAALAGGDYRLLR